ncbi:MAG TPA: GAF domain-containing protein, partial [Steroidobacter sp.]|nr:GAF domain-containing protein [Steroidobacter sp.]
MTFPQPQLGDSFAAQRELQGQGVRAAFTDFSTPLTFIGPRGTIYAPPYSPFGSPGQRTQKRLQHAAMRKLIDAAQELSLANNWGQAADIVRRAACELTGADGASFAVLDAEQACYVDDPVNASLSQGRRFPLTLCAAGSAMVQRRSVVIPDVRKEAETPLEDYRGTSAESIAVAPIRAPEPLGAIGVYWVQRHDCTPKELMLLQALANTAAAAIEKMRVYATVERLIEERTRELQTANKELEAFASAVSHDLRARLRAMSATIEGLDAGLFQERELQQER